MFGFYHTNSQRVTLILKFGGHVLYVEVGESTLRWQSQSQRCAGLCWSAGSTGTQWTFQGTYMKWPITENQYMLIIVEEMSQSQNEQSSRKHQNQAVKRAGIRKCVRKKPRGCI